MANSLRDTIKELTEKHLLSGSYLASQCVTAVGWIAGTVPQIPEHIIELPTSDVSNGGVLVGLALTQCKPIYVIRYQGFMTYNGASILNYAAKSKEMWQTPCPLFVRAIGMEGAIGPVATGMHHSHVMRYPGIRVIAPMTPLEWTKYWNEFLNNDDPVYCSEHRLSYDNTNEFNSLWKESKITIVGIGPIRLNLHKLSYNEIHVSQLKPHSFTLEEEKIIRNSSVCLVVDSDYQICGASEHLALKIQNQYNIKAIPLGLKDLTAGFTKHKDNITLTIEEIQQYVKNNIL